MYVWFDFTLNFCHIAMMYIPPDLFQLHDHVVLSVHTPDVIYPHNFVHSNITSIIPRHTWYHLVACMGNNAISV